MMAHFVKNLAYLNGGGGNKAYFCKLCIRVLTLL